MDGRSREEVLNVALARLLRQHGIVSAAERITSQPITGARAMPDVLVEYQNLRLIIEGKFDRTPKSGRQVQKQAYDRVVSGLAHLALAVLYPRDLATVTNHESALAQSILKISVFGEFSQLEEAPWEEGTVDDIANLLMRSYDRMTQGDVVRQAADTIRQATEDFSIVFQNSPAALDRAVRALGIRSLTPTNDDTDDDHTEGE
jgi:hypothetical protein